MFRRTCRGIKHLFSMHTVEVKKATACRAVFIDSHEQRVDCTLEIEDGTVLVLSMHPDVAARFILQMGTTYNAIRPPLTLGTNRAGWQGMD